MKKLCSKCERTLELSEFHIDRTSKDGHVHFCKQCTSKDRKRYYCTYRKEYRKRSYERYHVSKFMRENPTHWITRIFAKCPQCRQWKFVTAFSNDRSLFCDQCLVKNEK